MTSKKYIYEIPDDQNHAANKVLKLVSSGSEVLEIGCASGVQSRVLKEELGCRITGVEINPLAAEDARPFCENLIVGNIEEIDLSEDLGNKRYDFILLVDVLEHLLNPKETLVKILPFLKDDGRLITSIPNIAHAAICWELAHGRFDYQEYGLLDNTHIRFFTKKNIYKMFEDANYRIASLDRVIKLPEETEFNIFDTSIADRPFIEWILQSNPEATTYQFIISARHAKDSTEESVYDKLADIDITKKLENEIDDLKRQNLNLNSKIDWLESHRFGPYTKTINKLLSAFKN
jgi:2-polyprenyl-3-methyl-5-hydroxy-6-metoxy-1,4-benzoquinol methylase